MKLKEVLKITAAVLLIPGGTVIVPLYFYKKYRDKKKREKAIDELVAESERLGLYEWQQKTKAQDET